MSATGFPMTTENDSWRGGMTRALLWVSVSLLVEGLVIEASILDIEARNGGRVA
jgi:hypothetical protein